MYKENDNIIISYTLSSRKKEFKWYIDDSKLIIEKIFKNDSKTKQFEFTKK